MRLDGTIMLAGFTSRTNAYVQAMAHAGLEPQKVLLFGSASGKLPGQSVRKNLESPDSKNVFLPDFSMPLTDCLSKLGWQTKHLEADHVKDSVIYQAIVEERPKLIVYSGYGAQLVPSTLLDLSIPFLHCHSGWLPDYRGSTTLYYSWLREGFAAVSAIFLDRNIDTGPIIKRKKYPPPPPGIDVDYVYDCAIRADTLIDALKVLSRNEPLDLIRQENDGGTTYFVIHPLLKHLALLKNEGAE